MTGSTSFEIIFSTTSLSSMGDDCACPADGLTLREAAPVDDEDLLRAVRLFLEPVDNEHVVGYSPFASAGQSS